ncbi:MAG: ribosome silencing factor, partial [Mucinivorans sp.]
MKLLETIVKAIDDKKGENITSLDLRALEGTVCDYFVVCSAESTVQVSAIAAGIEEDVFVQTGEKVIRTHGTENALWIAMDY